MHTLWFYLGTTDANSWTYLAWSGFVGKVAFPSALFAGWWKHHNCHEPGCRRMGHLQPSGRVECRHHRTR